MMHKILKFGGRAFVVTLGTLVLVIAFLAGFGQLSKHEIQQPQPELASQPDSVPKHAGQVDDGYESRPQPNLATHDIYRQGPESRNEAAKIKSAADLENEKAEREAESLKQIKEKEERAKNEGYVLHKGYFVDDTFGIKFALQDEWSQEAEMRIKVQDNTIMGFENPNYIQLFTKKEHQTIEQAILAAVTAKGKDARDCKVVKDEKPFRGNEKYSTYRIEFANPNISFTPQELERIRLADLQALENDPFTGEAMKNLIYSERLVEKCSEYAETRGVPLHRGSFFVYDNKNRFIFLYLSPDPVMYHSIEF